MSHALDKPRSNVRPQCNLKCTYILFLVQVSVQIHTIAIIYLREFCMNQLCIVMHSTAKWRIGRPGNSLISKGQEFDIAD